MKRCKHIKLRPESKVGRMVFRKDGCNHKNVKNKTGIGFEIVSMKDDKLCEYQGICKYYEVEENDEKIESK